MNGDFTAATPLRFLKAIFALVFLAALGAAGYGAWYLLTPLKIDALPIEVEIPAGARFRAAIDALEKAGVQIRRYEFELLARALKRSRDVKAGSYELARAVTPLELLDKLTRGDVTQAEVRLIEG